MDASSAPELFSFISSALYSDRLPTFLDLYDPTAELFDFYLLLCTLLDFRKRSSFHT